MCIVGGHYYQFSIVRIQSAALKKGRRFKGGPSLKGITGERLGT